MDKNNKINKPIPRKNTITYMSQLEMISVKQRKKQRDEICGQIFPNILFQSTNLQVITLILGKK